MLVLSTAWLGDTSCAARRGRLVLRGRILDAERDGSYAITVQAQMVGDRTVGLQRRREHEAHLALLQDVAGTVTDAGFRSGVGDDVEAERCAVVVGGLARVADPQLDVVGSLERRHGSLGELVHTRLLSPLRFNPVQSA